MPEKIKLTNKNTGVQIELERVFNQKTGEIGWLDPNGDIHLDVDLQKYGISKPNLPTEHVKPIPLDPRSKLAAEFGYAGDYLKERAGTIGTVGGGIAGGVAGAPFGPPGIAIGSATGGFLGGLLGRSIEKGSTDLSASDVMDAGIGAAIDTGLGLLPFPAAKAIHGLKDKAFMKFFSPGSEALPEDIAAVVGNPNLVQPTLGQATKNKFTQFLENALSPGRKSRLELQQRDVLVPQGIINLRKDITGAAEEISLENYGKSTKQAIRDYINWNSQTPEEVTKLTNKFGKFLNSDPQLLVDKIKTRKDARQIREVLGSQNKEIYQGMFFEKIWNQKAFSAADRKIYPNEIVNEFLDINSPARELFTKKERAAVVDFFRNIRSISNKDPMTGLVAFEIREAGFALNLASGAATVLRTGASAAIPGAAQTATIAFSAIIPATRFVNKVLFNPDYAKYARRLAGIRPTSAETAPTARKMLRALKGTQILLDVPGRFKMNGYVDSEGKISVIPSENQQ